MFFKAGTRRALQKVGLQKCSKRLYHPTVLPSLISTTSPEFISKKEAMDDLIEELDAKTAKARLGGGATAQERMRSRGKLLPRERCVD